MVNALITGENTDRFFYTGDGEKAANEEEEERAAADGGGQADVGQTQGNQEEGEAEEHLEL